MIVGRLCLFSYSMFSPLKSKAEISQLESEHLKQ